MSFKPLIILPAYNTASTLVHLLPALPIDQTLVIDDGSSDGTAAMTRQMGYRVISHTNNQGVSRAIDSGLAYARAKNYSHVLCLDADGQHPATAYRDYFAALAVHDYLIADRFAQLDDIPSSKLAANVFASHLLAACHGVFMRDVACGLRGFPTHSPIWQHRQHGYGAIYSQTLNLMQAGIRPARVLIPAIYPLEAPPVTRRTEVCALLESVFAAVQTPLPEKITALRAQVAQLLDFSITLADLPFVAHYIPHWDAYLFHTNISLARQHYATQYCADPRWCAPLCAARGA